MPVAAVENSFEAVENVAKEHFGRFAGTLDGKKQRCVQDSPVRINVPALCSYQPFIQTLTRMELWRLDAISLGMLVLLKLTLRVHNFFPATVVSFPQSPAQIEP